MVTIKAAKLTNGQEIVFKVKDEQFLQVSDVHAIMLHEMENGHFGISLLPWLVANKSQTVMLSPSSVATEFYDVSGNIEQMFLQVTSSIALPGSGIAKV